MPPSGYKLCSTTDEHDLIYSTGGCAAGDKGETTSIIMGRSDQTRNKLIIVGVILFIIGLVIGVLSGYFGRRVADPTGCPSTSEEKDGVFLENVSPKIIADADPTISQKIIDEINADKIREYLRDLTSKPHLAGTIADLDQAKELKRIWEAQGLDRVDIKGYNVLLSYPEKDDPNLIKLIADNGTAVFTSQREEKTLRAADITPDDDIVPPFNSYSPPGDVTSEKMYYVNYGLEEDFFWLQNNKSINFTDSVVIARYGKAFRANKVQIAEKYGAKAVIFFSDPFDYASPGETTAYPDSWWLPGTGVQRGTVKVVSGDPTTYMYPSLDSAYRSDPDDSPYLPGIPAHPIGSDDAKQLLIRLAGEEAPDTWQGAITNVTYKIGGSFVDSGMTVNVHITTHNQFNKTYTVVGYITGSVEPDRYVVVGNHRDGWVFGSLDPSSGTAAMLETSRAMTSVMKSTNWRPRRTIVFCSWGAEEHGLVGSFEFMEHFNKVMGQRAVAYLNVDILIEGMDFLRFKSSPLLHTVIYKAAKKIPNPNSTEVAAGMKTIYDQWLHYYPDTTVTPNVPKMMLVGSGSDYEYFLQVLGIPSLEPRYTFDRSKYKLSSYPMYHSVYETFYLVDHIMDPGFKKSQSVTRVWAELARDLSDSLLLPFDVVRFTGFVKAESKKITDAYKEVLVANNLTSQIDYLLQAVDDLNKVGTAFTQKLNSKSFNRQNPYEVREVNDKMMNLHRAFLDPQGLPEREYLKNTLSAPSKFNSYAGAIFPSLVDSLHRIEHNTDPEKWTKVKKAFSILTYYVISATSSLQESTEFSIDPL